MNTLYVGWPADHYTGVEDTIAYYEHFRALVERYDGDGEGYTTPAPWNQYIEEPEWLTKPIKHWEICNEPYEPYSTRWPDYENRTPADFRTYVRAASRGIHAADSEAKVMGPCIQALQDKWRIKGGTLLTMPPDSLWWWMLGDGMKEYYDIISVHEYSGAVASCFEKLDSMRVLLQDLGAGDKPVWITEKGWNTDNNQYPEPDRSLRYRDYAQGMLERGWLEKTTFFALKWGGFGILNSDWSHTHSYDTLKKFIRENIVWSVFQNDTIKTDTTRNGWWKDTIVVAGNSTYFVIEGNGSNGGNTTMRAGEEITLYPGFEVQEGGNFEAIILPSLQVNFSSSIKSKHLVGTFKTKEEENKPKEESIPTVFTCAQNRPNPFVRTTTINYGLPKDSDVNLTVFNLAGQTVKTLVNSQQSAGFRSVNWDGTNNAGVQLPQGTYFYVFKAGTFETHKKMILLK
jgi:hypothetical protein